VTADRRVEAGSAGAVATMSPGMFAMVMATGIVAVASSQQGIDRLADALYVVAAAGYVVIAVLHVMRAIRFRPLLVADLTNHAKGFALLTAVAATNVMAAASLVLHGWRGLAWVLWWVGLALWPVLLYTTLIAVIIRHQKPGLASGINGTWFLLTVSTESIAVVAALLQPRSGSDLLAVVALAMFFLGGVLYLIVMTMVFLRWTFQPLDPGEADPPAWIAAGAVAITVLAGSNLILAGEQGSARLSRLEPVLEAAVIGAWATSTFWFPPMVAIGIWRHVVRQIPLRYHPGFWAMVFPLGMYGASTFQLIRALDVADADWLPKVVLAVALTAWTATFAGLLHQLRRTRRPTDALRP